MPYMAQRAATDSTALSPPQGDSQQPGDVDAAPAWQRGVGAFGVFIGLFSMGWWAIGRPEYGDVTERLAYFSNKLANQRVFGGYLVDLGIYWLAQWLLMRGAGAGKGYSAVPFFGLGSWLAAGRPDK